MDPNQKPNSLRKRVWLATLIIRIHLSVAARLQVFTRVTKIGTRHIPKKGAVIFAAMHPSSFDVFPVWGGIWGRNLAFMADSNLFKGPILGPFMRWMGHIPVARGTDAARDSLEFAARVLELGGAVGMFPWGKTSQGTGMLKSKTGMARLAYRTNAPVIPIAFTGTHKVKPAGKLPRLFQRVEMVIGAPIRAPRQTDNPTYAELAAFTELWESRVAVLSGQEAA